MHDMMQTSEPASYAAMLRVRLLRKAALVPLGAVLALAAASTAAAQPAVSAKQASAPVLAAAQAEDDDAVVLPTRVAQAISRTQTALANAAEHIDEGEYKQAIVSLRAVKNNMYRADTAARQQMAAVPADPDAEPADPADPDAEPADPADPDAEPADPADPDAEPAEPADPADPDAEPADPAEPAEPADTETTPGPDSVIAVLTLDQTIVTSLAGLFDANSQGLVVALTHTLFQTMSARDKLLTAVIGLDPELAGAAYADGMADTLDGYTDEVANLTEALQFDKLSVGGKKVLTAALAKSQATLTQVNTAFGGGE
jgi:hypothetical protein